MVRMIGQPVIKPFIDESTARMRWFVGVVTDADDTCALVSYADDDKETVPHDEVAYLARAYATLEGPSCVDAPLFPAECPECGAALADDADAAIDHVLRQHTFARGSSIRVWVPTSLASGAIAWVPHRVTKKMTRTNCVWLRSEWDDTTRIALVSDVRRWLRAMWGA